MAGDLWDELWENWSVQEWDNVSEEIYRVLKKEIGGFEGKRILEAGSGTGRISLKLAQEGAELTLVDYSGKALEISRDFFDKHDVKAQYINIDLNDGLPFEDDAFDIVWNAGVMEHFTEDRQIMIFREFARVAPEVHTFNPNKRSFFYRLGKFYAEKNNIWPYGVEYPVESLSDIFRKSGLKLQKEYSIAFGDSLAFLRLMPEGEGLKNQIEAFLNELENTERQRIQGRMGGYLLYSKGIML